MSTVRQSLPSPAKSRWPALMLMLAVVAEVGWYAFLMRNGPADFAQAVSAADTPGYVSIAQSLAEDLSIPPTAIRTIGYPLFLWPCFLVGGADGGYAVAVAIQLVLNLLLTILVWQMLARLAPATHPAIRVALTGIFFWASAGPASLALSDFQAAFLLMAFFYILLFHRHPLAVGLGAGAILLLVLTRPTFSLMPLLVLPVAWLVGRITGPIPWRQVAVYAASALVACGISWQIERRGDDVVGAESFNAKHFRYIYVYQFGDGKGELAGKRDLATAEFNHEIEHRAGKPLTQVTRLEREHLARQILMENIRANPKQVLARTGAAFIRYIFAPIENLVSRLTNSGRPGITPPNIRLALFVACMPLWILCLWPPGKHILGARPYWWLAILMMAYVVGLSSAVGWAGERFRYNVLALMLPVAAVNLQSLLLRLRPAQSNARSVSCVEPDPKVPSEHD